MIYTTNRPVLAIGDCHGHLPRLEALLRQESIIDFCPACSGTGDDFSFDFCPKCEGIGTKRVRDDCVVVQLGDLGHFGSSWVGPPRGGHRVPGSPTADLLIYDHGSKWLDYVLWGNHDRAVIDGYHCFAGYEEPYPETFTIMKGLRDEERQLLAFAAHGFLLTHAGLHKKFKHNDVPAETKTDPVVCAKWINKNCDLSHNAIVDAIGVSRGGRVTAGGILWRDANESLHDGFRQVFGHTARDKVRRYGTKGLGDSYCIDVGQADNGRLAGIWLPEERVVEVKLDKVRPD